MPFATLGLPPVLVKGIRSAGFVEPTPLQRKAIPIILKGNDLIGVAQSGTGKTASYLLPTLTRLLEGPRRLRALVLVPTRELGAQVEAGARAFGRFTDLRFVSVYHGAPLAPQERQLREEGADLLIATPVRLLELSARQVLNYEDVEILVLDEADKMVEAGLAGDLRRILKTLPETRQTLLYCATLPPELNRLAKEALVEPIRVDLAPPSRPAMGITQAIYPVPRALKTDLLKEILVRNEVRSVIVYTNTRASADQLARQLQKRGHTVASLHGSDNQLQRERAVNDLKRGRVQILVATDVASRGIDMDGLTHVVNYDVPHRPEDYLHRIGRSAQGVPGDAFTLMSPEDHVAVAAIERYLGRTVPRVLLPDFDYRMAPSDIQKAVSYPPAEKQLPLPVKKVASPPPKPAPVKTAASKPPAPKPALKPVPRPVRPAPKSAAAAKNSTPASKPAGRPAAAPKVPAAPAKGTASPKSPATPQKSPGTPKGATPPPKPTKPARTRR